MMKACFGENRNEDDLMDFREIIAALYGVAPSRTSIKEFVKDQVWFNKEKIIKERNLNAKQKSFRIH
jgi:hypothetical protein